MKREIPHFLEAGAGPGVVCLHANASTSGQWRGLADLLAPRFHVVAPDLYGAGRSVDWPSSREIRLADEVAFIEPVLSRVSAPFALVGHSHGAAVALIAALTFPEQVAALVLYEPTLFALVDADAAPPNDADGIRDAVADAVIALDAGDAQRAAERFIDYWMEPGSWAGTPDRRKEAIAASIVNVRRWGHALFTEPTPLDAFRSIDVPVCLLKGRRSTAAAHAVIRLLGRALPRAELFEFERLGHMGPVTDPGSVNGVVSDFLMRVGRVEVERASPVGF